MDMILADSALKGLRPDPAWDVAGVRDMIGVNGSTTATTNNKQAAIAGIRESLKARAMRPSSSAANSEPTVCPAKPCFQPVSTSSSEKLDEVRTA